MLDGAPVFLYVAASVALVGYGIERLVVAWSNIKRIHYL